MRLAVIQLLDETANRVERLMREIPGRGRSLKSVRLSYSKAENAI
jgi:hypothetical protein